MVLFSSCEKDDIKVNCNEPLASSLTVGIVPENGCGILQELNLEVQTPIWKEAAGRVKLDVNLDGIDDFEMVASASVSPSHHNKYLSIAALDSQAHFGLHREYYSICSLVDGPDPAYFSLACKEKCSDFSPEEIKENQITHLEEGHFAYAEALTYGASFSNNLLWAQSRHSFTRPIPQWNPPYVSCSHEMTKDKWIGNTILYLPIKLIDDHGVVKLGWIKCNRNADNNPIYESYIQAY
ncbi:MAG: hypothetical protein AAF705_16785 [Bacteroidota bacterium]